MLYQLDYQFEYVNGPGPIMTVIGDFHSVHNMYSFITGSHDFNPDLPKIRAARIKSNSYKSHEEPFLYECGQFDRSKGGTLTRST